MTAEKDQQGTAQADIAAKLIGGIIIGGILLMFGYGLLHWIIFE